jgi:hypothetical protein
VLTIFSSSKCLAFSGRSAQAFRPDLYPHFIGVKR